MEKGHGEFLKKQTAIEQHNISSFSYPIKKVKNHKEDPKRYLSVRIGQQ